MTVFPANHFADDRIVIGFSYVGLAKRAAQAAKVLDDHVDRDVIFGVQWGHGTQLHNTRPRHSEDSRPAKRVDIRTACPQVLPPPVSLCPASLPAPSSRRPDRAGCTKSNTTDIACKSAACAT